MLSSSIERELIRCRQSAEEGYELSNAKYSDIKDTLIDADNSLSKTDAEQSQVSRIRNTELVAKQKSELQQLRNRIEHIGGDLQNLRGRMKDFTTSCPMNSTAQSVTFPILTATIKTLARTGKAVSKV